MSSRTRTRSLLLVCLLATSLLRVHASPQQPASSAPSASGVQPDPAALFAQAMQAMKANQLPAAENLFRRVIALDPNSSAAYINLGVSLMRERRWDDALTELHHAEKLSPQTPGIQLNIGLAYYRENNFEAAIAPFSNSLKLQSDSIQATYLLGLCYFFTNKYDLATQTLAPLWDRESSSLNYLYVLSISASKASNAALQKRAFDRMIEVGQGTPEFHLYVGKAYLAQNDTDKALSEFQAAAVAKPNLPLVHYFLGRTYLERYAYPQAEAEFNRDIALEPDFAYNYESLGMLYLKLDQQSKAEASFRQALERNQQLVNSWFELAKIYRNTARYPEALQMLQHCTALAPNSASVHYTLGQVLSHLGQREQSRQEFDTAANLLRSFHDRLVQDPSGTQSSDAQDAAQQ